MIPELGLHPEEVKRRASWMQSKAKKQIEEQEAQP